MKKLTLILAVALALAVTGTILRADPGERHVKADLEAIDNSGVTGFVNVTSNPKGGTRVNVVVQGGLEPGGTYTSFYYESTDCSAPADELGTFTADSNGRGHFSGETDEDLDEIGTISVRLGEGYGTLMACAALHAEQ